MPRIQEPRQDSGRAGSFIGFALFFPALILLYLLFAGANYVFFGSLS